jgi:hypothetical protein
MLTMIYGDVGTGKTLSLAYVAVNNPTIPALANFKLNLTNYAPIEPEMLIALPYNKSKVLIDEGYGWLDARLSSSKVNLYFSYILFQSRKTGCDIYVTSQIKRVVDIRYQDMVNYEVYCEKGETGFQYSIIHFNLYGNEYGYIELPFDKAEKYYPFYDTNEKVMTDRMSEMANDVMLMDKDKMRTMINNAVKEIFPEIGDKVTKNAIEVALLEHNYPSRLAKFVYVKIKDQKLKQLSLNNKKSN